MQKRKTVRAGFVELQWKPFFEGVESSRLRRGKSASKQGGSVSELSVREGFIQARVKGGGFRAEVWKVKIPTVDRWEAYLDEVALWLSRRPDWFASLLAEDWDLSFLEFVAGSGLKLFPDENAARRMIDEASCTCSDWEKPCPHMVTVVYDMIRNTEANPLRAMEYVGIDTVELLNRIHCQSVVEVHTDGAGTDGTVTNKMHDMIGGIDLWPEERAVLVNADTQKVDSLKHRIHPQLDPRKVEEWKKAYMAWK